jgi:hypothetical protein
MIVLCPFTNMDWRTEHAVMQQGHCGALLKFVPTNGEYGYWSALKREWTGRQDIVVIEQDMDLMGDEIRSFNECAEDWCTFRYPLFDGHRIPTAYGLGCVKFSVQLQQQTPGFCPATNWRVLDLAVYRMIVQAIPMVSLLPHVHGETGHYHTTAGFSALDWAHAKTDLQGPRAA